MSLESASALAGRDDVLADAVRRAEDGRGTIVLAPAGYGKSRMVGAIGTALGRRGVTTAHLTATASAASVPLGVFLTLIDAETADRVGRTDTLGRAALMRSAVHGLRLQALTIDEAGLLDPASAALVFDLAAGGVVVIATVTLGRRVPDAINALSASGYIVTVQLPPLAVTEAGALVQELLKGPVDSGAVRELARAAAGSPTTLRELVRYATGCGALVRTTELWRLVQPLPAPRAVQRALDDQVAQLDGALRRWLAVVAVAGQVSMTMAERLVTDEVADRAERDGWVRYDQATLKYAIDQPLHRTAILSSIGTRTRRTALRDLVAAAGAMPDDEALMIPVGTWRMELGEPFDVAAAIGLAAATSISDPELSERFLLVALSRGAGTPRTMAPAERTKRPANGAAAAELLDSVRHLAEDQEASDRIALMRAIATGIGGRRTRQALEALDSYIALHEPAADLLAVRVALLVRVRQIEEALALAQQLGHPRRTGFAAVFAGIHEVLVLGVLGRADDALEVIEQLREHAAQTLGPISEGPLTLEWLSGWIPAVVELDTETAATVAQHQYELAVDSGMHAARTQFAHLLAVCRIAQGDPRDAVQLLREAESVPGVWRDSWLPTIVAAQVEALAHSGDLAAAQQALTRLESIHATALHHTAVDLASAQLAASRGDAAGAIATARAAALRSAGEGAVVETFDALYAALRHGDDSAAPELLERDLPPGRIRDLQRAHARAVADGSPQALDDVAAGFWAAGARLLAISAAASALVRRSNEDGPARAAAAERLTMWSLETPTLIVHGMERLAVSALTVREREVVRLAAAGLADRAIAIELGISLRTAQTHLGRAFGKLGVHRRAQLRVLLDAV